MSYDDAISLGTLRTRQTADDIEGAAAERRTKNMHRHVLIAPWSEPVGANGDSTDPDTWAGTPGPFE